MTSYCVCSVIIQPIHLLCYTNDNFPSPATAAKAIFKVVLKGIRYDQGK